MTHPIERLAPPTSLLAAHVPQPLRLPVTEVQACLEHLAVGLRTAGWPQSKHLADALAASIKALTARLRSHPASHHASATELARQRSGLRHLVDDLSLLRVKHSDLDCARADLLQALESPEEAPLAGGSKAQRTDDSSRMEQGLRVSLPPLKVPRQRELVPPVDSPLADDTNKVERELVPPRPPALKLPAKKNLQLPPRALRTLNVPPAPPPAQPDTPMAYHAHKVDVPADQVNSVLGTPSARGDIKVKLLVDDETNKVRFVEIGGIGSGDFSEVGLVEDLKTRKQMAIKTTTRPSSPGSQEEHNSTTSVDAQREFFVTQALHGPSFAHHMLFLDRHNKDAMLFELMGGSLLDVINGIHRFAAGKEQRSALAAILAVAAPSLADQLVNLHENAKYLSGDGKTANVLVAAGDQRPDFKLSDFGLAQPRSPEDGLVRNFHAGSRGFTAPEVIFSGEASTQADAWPLGVILSDVFLGRMGPRWPPVDSKRAEEVELNLYGSWHADMRAQAAPGGRIQHPAGGFDSTNAYGAFFNAVHRVRPFGPSLSDALINDFLHPNAGRRFNSREAAHWAHTQYDEPAGYLAGYANDAVAAALGGSRAHAQISDQVAQMASAITRGDIAVEQLIGRKRSEA